MDLYKSCNLVLPAYAYVDLYWYHYTYRYEYVPVFSSRYLRGTRLPVNGRVLPMHTSQKLGGYAYAYAYLHMDDILAQERKKSSHIVLSHAATARTLAAYN